MIESQPSLISYQRPDMTGYRTVNVGADSDNYISRIFASAKAVIDPLEQSLVSMEKNAASYFTTGYTAAGNLASNIGNKVESAFSRVTGAIGGGVSNLITPLTSSLTSPLRWAAIAAAALLGIYLLTFLPRSKR